MILLFVFHAFYASLIGFGLALGFGKLTFPISLVSLALAAWPAWRHAKAFSDSDAGYRFNGCARGLNGILELGLFTTVLFACYRHFMWLLYSANHSLMTLDVYNLGDLPLHLTYIRALANGVRFPPMNPGFAAEQLHYPFGPDFYNALWESVGLRTQFHLFITGIVASIASLIVLRRYGGWWAIGAFFFNGGILGYSVLAGYPLVDWQSQIDWKHLFLTVFITQRGILFALPAGLFLLNEVRKHLTGRPLTGERAIAFGLIWGILPFFHTHAFVAVSLMIAGSVLIETGWRGTLSFLTSRLACLAYVIAIYFVWRATNGTGTLRVIHWDAAWTSTPEELPGFLWRNFGLWLLVIVLIPAVLWMRRAAYDTVRLGKLFAEWTLYVGLFILFFDLMLAPWSWDNIKILIWPYLGIVRLACVAFEPLFQARREWLRLPVALVLFCTGFSSVSVSLAKPSDRGTAVYSEGELAQTEGALTGIDANAVFASAPSYNHTLTYYGRLRVMDYNGHLWSHGITYQPTELKLEKLMNGDPQWRAIARDLHATHIFWGPSERQRYGEGQRPWMTELKDISRVPGYGIYVIQ